MDQIVNALKFITDRMEQKSGSKQNEEQKEFSQSDGTNRTAKTKSTIAGGVRSGSKAEKLRKIQQSDKDQEA